MTALLVGAVSGLSDGRDGSNFDSRVASRDERLGKVLSLGVIILCTLKSIVFGFLPVF